MATQSRGHGTQGEGPDGVRGSNSGFGLSFLPSLCTLTSYVRPGVPECRFRPCAGLDCRGCRPGRTCLASRPRPVIRIGRQSHGAERPSPQPSPRPDHPGTQNLVEVFLGGAIVATTEERVIQIVCDNLGVNKEQVSRSTKFQDDIGADSLDIVELVMELEEE